MDFVMNFPFITIVLSLFSAVVGYAQKGKRARFVSYFLLGASSLLHLGVLFYNLTGDGYFVYRMGHYDAPIGNEISAGLLEPFFALLFSLVMLFSLLGGAKRIFADLEEEKYKLMLFSKDASEVAYAHNKLVEIATAPLVAEIEEQKPKVEYHDDVLNKEGLITTTVIAKDLGFKSATKLNKIMNMNKIIFKNQSGIWCPYADYEWLISDGYADYQSYTQEHSSPCLKWTEKGRKWIIENYNNWVMKLVS